MELFRALAVFAEPPSAESVRVAEALELGALPTADEYTELFLFQLYPYASVYLGTEGMLGGEARDRIAGFWRALGQTPTVEPDHLSVMLAFYARLCELETNEGDARRCESWRGARKAFLWEHMLSWLPVYLSKLNELASPFYQRWSELLSETLDEEAATIGRQESLPLHLRESSGLIDLREGAFAEFLQSVLTPARSGMILTRADLSRAARALNLGLRIGERKFVLRALFDQDAHATLAWLGAEAAEWRERHKNLRGVLGDVALVWEERAAAAATLLETLRQTAAEASLRT